MWAKNVRTGRESFRNNCYRVSSSLLILPRYWPSNPDEVAVSTYLGRWRSWQSPTVTPWGDKIIIRVSCFLLRLSRLTLFIILLMEEILYQVVDRLSHYLQGFIHPKWCRISSTNSRTFIFWGISTGKNLLETAKKKQFSSRRSSGCMVVFVLWPAAVPAKWRGHSSTAAAMGQMSFATSCLADKEKSRIDPMKFLTSRIAPRML